MSLNAGFCLYLASVPRGSVSVRGGRRRSLSVPLDPAGLLAPRLLLGAALDHLVRLRRSDRTLTLVAGVTAALLVLSGSVSENGKVQTSVYYSFIL